MGAVNHGLAAWGRHYNYSIWNTGVAQTQPSAPSHFIAFYCPYVSTVSLLSPFLTLSLPTLML
jgi:hypothetical protein